MSNNLQELQTKLIQELEDAATLLETKLAEEIEAVTKKAFTLGFICAATKLSSEPTTKEWLDAKQELGL